MHSIDPVLHLEQQILAVHREGEEVVHARVAVLLEVRRPILRAHPHDGQPPLQHHALPALLEGADPLGRLLLVRSEPSSSGVRAEAGARGHAPQATGPVMRPRSASERYVPSGDTRSATRGGARVWPLSQERVPGRGFDQLRLHPGHPGHVDVHEHQVVLGGEALDDPHLRARGDDVATRGGSANRQRQASERGWGRTASSPLFATSHSMPAASRIQRTSFWLTGWSSAISTRRSVSWLGGCWQKRSREDAPCRITGEGETWPQRGRRGATVARGRAKCRGAAQGGRETLGSSLSASVRHLKSRCEETGLVRTCHMPCSLAGSLSFSSDCCCLNGDITTTDTPIRPTSRFMSST